MSFKFFYVPSRNPESTEAELNSVLASHRVVTIERKFVENGAVHIVKLRRVSVRSAQLLERVGDALINVLALVNCPLNN
jgi:hypothetical protein